MAIVFFMGLLVHLSFWHFPLLELGALKTPIQDENFTDQNFYLHVAERVCRMPTWTLDDITVTWSATGVIGYLTYGCRILGTEYFYVLVNPLLVALSIGYVADTGRRLGCKIHIPAWTIVALPYTWMTLSLPGKEVLSVVGTLVMVAGLMRLSARRQIALGFVSLLLGLSIVSLNRLHEAGVLAMFCLLWLTGTMRSPFRLLLLVWIATSLAGPLLANVRLNQGAESLTDEILWSGSSEGKAVDLDGLFSLLRSDNLFVHALLGLLRVAVVTTSPLSSLVTPPTDADWAYFVFRDLSQRLRLFDFGLMAYTATCLVSTRRRERLTPLTADRDLWMLPLLFIYMLYVISFFGVSQKSRYIFQYTPLLLVWLWLRGLPESRPVMAANPGIGNA
jgi:hypothetical protein